MRARHLRPLCEIPCRRVAGYKVHIGLGEWVYMCKWHGHGFAEKIPLSEIYPWAEGVQLPLLAPTWGYGVRSA